MARGDAEPASGADFLFPQHHPGCGHQADFAGGDGRVDHQSGQDRKRQHKEEVVAEICGAEQRTQAESLSLQPGPAHVVKCAGDKEGGDEDDGLERHYLRPWAFPLED